MTPYQFLTEREIRRRKDSIIKILEENLKATNDEASAWAYEDAIAIVEDVLDAHVKA